MFVQHDTFTAWRCTGTWTVSSLQRRAWEPPISCTQSTICLARRPVRAGAQRTAGWSWAAGTGQSSTHMTSWRWAHLRVGACSVTSTVADVRFDKLRVVPERRVSLPSTLQCRFNVALCCPPSPPSHTHPPTHYRNCLQGCRASWNWCSVSSYFTLAGGNWSPSILFILCSFRY